MSVSLKYSFSFVPRPMLRLSEIERIIKECKIMKTAPSRNTLIAMCEDGTFEAKKTRLGWLVFEDSFKKWVEDLQAI
ncbi:MAG TPA: hypothetical protein PKY59_12420 [Pyrinomonadaceae bacterium]|nr:hypothetical protein [Pyrinomonadaceae bacterium]